MKKCNSCYKILPFDAFHKRKSKEYDGYQNKCKECIREYSLKYYSTNKEKYAQRASTYYDKYSKRFVEYSRNYHKENFEKVSSRQKKYYRNNVDKFYTKHLRYKTKQKDLWIEDIDRNVVFERCNWICGWCNKLVDKNLKFPHSFSASIDHIKPISKGGEHSYSNVQLMHLVCNKRKSDVY